MSNLTLQERRNIYDSGFDRGAFEAIDACIVIVRETINDASAINQYNEAIYDLLGRVEEMKQEFEDY